MSVWSRVMMVVLSFALWGCPEPPTDLSALACPDSTRMYRDATGECVCDEGFSFNSDGTQCVACTPSCAADAECGSDGCGGSCGTCDADEVCGAGGACELCVPSCHGKVCGPDGCGGSCGSCAPGDNCESGACVTCRPQCDGKTCGPDGCGGTCGECAPGQACYGGACQQQCVPQCSGRACGSDGCGGSCGTCSGGQTCQAGVCQSPAPTGAPSGTMLVPCNCGTAPAGAQPGMSFQEAQCASGVATLGLCQGCCQTDGFTCYGYPWAYVCQ